MTASVSRLLASREGETTRIARAYAQAPQRWTFGQAAADGWAEVSHQVLGDGAFGGDRSRATIRVSPGASLLVRGVAATPLRGNGESAAAVRLRVAEGGALLYVPGAIVPHAGASHTSSLWIKADAGAAVLAAATLVPGRSGMGESGVLNRLRLKTRVEVGTELALLEDTEVAAADISRIGSFGAAGAFVSAVCLGDWTPHGSDWVAAMASGRGLVAVSQLRVAGIGIRGLFRSLGDAQEFLATVEAELRQRHASCMGAVSNRLEQAGVY